jgi:hypothetical protein
VIANEFGAGSRKEMPMKDSLATYLHDHLAGASYAIDLVKAMQDHYAGQPLGEFSAEMHSEITKDRDTLREIAARVGASSISPKDGVAWLAEKVSRIKLQHSDSTGLGTFEALEFLELGIHGKLALWRVLAKIAPSESRLTGFDFDSLMSRAEDQAIRVEKHRMAAAHNAFLSSPAR